MKKNLLFPNFFPHFSQMFSVSGCAVCAMKFPALGVAVVTSLSSDDDIDPLLSPVDEKRLYLVKRST